MTLPKVPEPAEGLVDRVALALGDPGRLGVAFSGGVDSTVLLAVAARALGHANVIALLGVSPSLPASERADAHGLASALGVSVVEVHTREEELPGYRANGPDRCFHCKSELFGRISEEIVTQHGLDAVAYGENADDAARPDRPGSRAASERGVLRPLAVAGLTKREVRELARELGLPNADKPAAPCLASRVPHFEEVTPAKLRQIEDAESAVRALGFSDVRVRHHGEVARVELPSGEIARAASELREALISGVKAAGFRFVTLDLSGIQSGAFTLPLVVRSSAAQHEPALAAPVEGRPRG